MRRGRGSLIAGVGLVAAGVVFMALHSGSALIPFLIHFWPLILVGFGAFRIFGFLHHEHPRTPVGRALLVGVGGLFLINSFDSNLNAFQVFGRFWPFLLLAFALGELVFQYHLRSAGRIVPQVITTGKVLAVIGLVIVGTASSRLARTNPNLFSSSAMPAVWNQFCDAMFGREFQWPGAPQSFPARPGEQMIVKNSYGDIEVRVGTDNELKVVLNKSIRAHDEASAAETAQQIKLIVTKTDQGYSIGTNRDSLRQRFRTNLIVYVPTETSMQVENRYGDLNLADLTGDQAIAISNGHLKIHDIQGDVSINGSQQEVDVADIGNLKIDCQRGKIQASNINGDAEIHASLTRTNLLDVSGAVKLSNKNGNDHLAGIEGTVTYEGDQGQITGEDWRADANIETSHGRVSLSKINGPISITAPNSPVEVTDVAGRLTLSDCSYDEITLKRIKGDVDVAGNHSKITADQLDGKVSIQTSYGAVNVKNFTGSLNCETSYQPITLAPTAVSADIEATNQRGAINIELPPASNFNLDAHADHNKVKVFDFGPGDGIQGEVLSAAFGSRGPLIRLATTYANIKVESNRAAHRDTEEIRNTAGN